MQGKSCLDQRDAGDRLTARSLLDRQKILWILITFILLVAIVVARTILIFHIQEYIIVFTQLQKFKQVGVDVKCMHINFGGHGLSGFGDIATFKNGQISLSDHGHQKI